MSNQNKLDFFLKNLKTSENITAEERIPLLSDINVNSLKMCFIFARTKKKENVKS